MPAAAAVRPPQEDKYLKDLVAELHLWSRMHHPNICQFLGAVTRARESVLLVADYCERGSLHRVLMGHLRERSKMPFATRMRYARGIACGMAYLHRQRIPAGPRTPGSSGGGQEPHAWQFAAELACDWDAEVAQAWGSAAKLFDSAR